MPMPMAAAAKINGRNKASFNHAAPRAAWPVSAARTATAASFAGTSAVRRDASTKSTLNGPVSLMVISSLGGYALHFLGC